MTRFNHYYVGWFLARLAKKMGIFGWIGLLILTCCGIFYIVKLLPLNQQVESLENQLAQYKLDTRGASQVNSATNQNSAINQAQLASSKQLPLQNLQVSQLDIARFYALFPQGATLPQWLNLIAQTALKQGLTLNRGDYKLTAQQILKPQLSKTTHGQFARYEIVLPVTGQYTQIRQFMTDVMQQIPAIALNDLQIKRQSLLSPVVEARLVFVLLLQGDSW